MNKKHTQRLSKRNPFIKDSLFIKSANYSLLSFIFGIIILFASFGFRSTALEDDHQPTIFARSIVTLERIVVKKIIASKQKIALEIDEHKSALMNVASSFTKKGGTASTPHSIIAYSTGSPNEYAISASGDTRNGAASNATGAPDGITTEVGSNSDYLVLTLANELPVGTDYTIYISGRGGAATADVYEAPDGTTVPTSNNPNGFTQNGIASSGAGGSATTVTKTTVVATKYLYFERGSDDIEIDAVEYCLAPETCAITVTQSTQSACQDNGTPTDVNDDYFTVTVNASVVLGDTNFEAVLGANLDGTGGTVLGSAAYGTPITLGDGTNGATGIFAADGSSTYTITIRGVDADTCFAAFTTTPMNDCTFIPACNCTEYMYLNETSNNGAIHKFKINNDTTFTEIGSPWYQNPSGGDLTTPHGLAIDQNGFIYAGETATGREIRKFDCDGNIFPESNFSISNGGQTNIVTLNGFLYANDWQNDEIKKWDICTQTQVSTADVCNGITRIWGLHYSKYTNKFYSTSALGNETNSVYVYEDSDFDNNSSTCISGMTLPNLPPQAAEVGGITTDPLGSIYVVVRDDGGDSYILKYGPEPNYNFIRSSAIDDSEDGIGWNRAMGIRYSETINMLLVSTRSPIDDCVALFDTTLAYAEAAIPPTGNNTQAKGIALTIECCPTPGALVIENPLCGANIGDSVFLREITGCGSPICQGLWTEDIGNTGLSYNACDNSVTVTASNACGSFTISSDGTGNNAQCEAFSITVNISTLTQPTVSVNGDQTHSCPIGTFTALTATTTNADSIQWQMSTTSCLSDFTDIVGAINNTYTPTGLTDTTYFRAIVFNKGTCADGNCEVTSTCITVNVEESCVIPCTNPTATAFAIQPSCDHGIPQSDGYLQLSAVTDGTSYHWSTGSIFDDNSGANTFANATDISSATFPLQFNTGLSNTNVGDYTIRVFNGASACFTDYTVTLNMQDCTVGCDCKEMIYVNDETLDLIHKFEINSTTGALTEIGSPWLDNFNNPHGLATDINGFL